MSGRKPIPTNLKIVKGTAQPCRILKDEAKPKADAVRMPAGLSDDAKKQWKIAAKHLTAAGLLTNLDTFALAMYCEVFARWTYANDQIKKFGPIVKAPSGYPVQSPFLQIANKSFDQMTKMLVEFGMTPSSRSRVAGAGPAVEEDDGDPLR
jgi:P27 family predicted phage terminase small subunit